MTDSTLALKFLDAGAVGPYSGFRWPKPRGSRPGKWVHVDGDLDMCKRGIHACTFAQATRWLREECYVIELRDVVSDDGAKLLARSGRLVRRVDSWGQRAMVPFAADCAAHVLPAFEKKYPKDDQPRKAIRAARKWARSPSEKNASYAASSAAYDAYDAAYDAAYAASAAAQVKERAWQTKRLRHYIKAPEVAT